MWQKFEFFQNIKKYSYWISFNKINSRQHDGSNGFKNRFTVEEKNAFEVWNLHSIFFAPMKTWHMSLFVTPSRRWSLPLPHFRHESQTLIYTGLIAKFQAIRITVTTICLHSWRPNLVVKKKKCWRPSPEPALLSPPPSSPFSDHHWPLLDRLLAATADGGWQLPSSSACSLIAASFPVPAGESPSGPAGAQVWLTIFSWLLLLDFDANQPILHIIFMLIEWMFSHLLVARVVRFG